MKKKKEMTLREYYTSLIPLKRQEMEISIAQKCMKSPGTVRQWIYGCRNPSALCKKLMIELLSDKVTIVFPETVNEKVG